MTFSKSLLIATLSLGFFVFSAPVNATTETKPTVAAQPAAAPAAAPTPAPSPAAAMAPAAAQPAPNATQVAPRLARQQQKVDLKNLPPDVTSLLPLEGDTFILAEGESKVITAARPRKCPEKEAPNFEDTKLRLPVSEIISYSDGGIRQRYSLRCHETKLARVIVATGVKKGTQKMEVLGAMLTVIVK